MIARVISISITLGFGLLGCVTKTVVTDQGRYLIPDADQSESQTLARDFGTAFSWRSLGWIEYDDYSLPLVSPNGMFIAVRSGPPPHAAHVGATTTESAPRLGTLRSFRVDDTNSTVETLFSIDVPWLLGRECNANGFVD